MKHIFRDEQVGGYSAFTSIDALAEHLAADWLQVVHSDENYEGEYLDEKAKWKNATLDMKKEIIINNEYTILQPTPENIKSWEHNQNDVWEEQVR